MKNKKLFLFLILIISVIFGCQKQQVQTKIQAKEVIPVKIVRIKLQEFEEILEYVGNIKAKDEAEIYPKVSGKIIEKVKEDGAWVRKGDIIAYIDRDEVGLKFEKAPVESPLTGVIGRIYVDIGTNVSPQTPIGRVVNMDEVKIELEIPEKYLSEVFVGQSARIFVDAWPDEEFRGRVTKISPVVDIFSRTAPLEIIVDNPEYRLKSGMFARVGLIVKSHKNVPVVLKEAILGRMPNFYVYIVENQKAVLRNVKLGIRQGPYYEIKEGLREGDLVVIMGQQRLYEGAEVRVEE
ncbi:MAG: efflux RND transporter periplasmic adaptor subunit [Candidatus Omnitrophica bacterium]|nr:efflux RND transporter periplasmic adaptor subunit [Candidatus Omnitrophota bacterium]